MSEISERAQRFRFAIAAFIEAQREAKLTGKPDEKGEYDYDTWIANIAKRAKEIQLTTHPLKATFPDAKITQATSPYVQGRELPKHSEIGSHLINYDVLDVSGNAAALGVFGFLSETIVESKPLLYWLLNDDPDLLSALNADAVLAKQLLDAFKRIDRTKERVASHFGAKQVYWLVAGDPVFDSGYHLLQPMFATSLAHRVHAEIQDARFGESNKQAREAYRARKPHDRGYREYRNLVARKLGGTKPQNISQFNSERGGVNYLLASLPPTWTRSRSLDLLKQRTVFQVFLHYAGVRGQVRALVKLLKDHAEDASTMTIRQARERIEQDLGAGLAAFGLEQQQRYAPGWTRESACQLPACECLWLDPGRAELPSRPGREEADESFRTALAHGDWADEVAGRFANWLNDQLREAGLTAVGDIEARHWARQAIVDVTWPTPLQRQAGGTA